MSRQYLGQLMRATRGARNPNLQVVITHASHVCSQHSFGLPLRTNGMHRTQFDHARFDILLLVIWSRVFWPSVTRNVRKAQRWSKSVWTSDLSRPHSLTFGYYKYYYFCAVRAAVLVEFHKFCNLNRVHGLFHPRYFENWPEPVNLSWILILKSYILCGHNCWNACEVFLPFSFNVDLEDVYA